MRWGSALSATVAVCALMVSGCGPAEGGRVGVGRADDGSLQVLVRACRPGVEGAVLYWPDDPDGASSNEEVFASWTVDSQRDPGRAGWPLLGPGGDGVTAEQVLSEIPGPPKNMAILAGLDDDEYSARGPHAFTRADLAALRPGEVLVADESGDPTDPNRPVNVVVDRSAFDALDCSRYP